MFSPLNIIIRPSRYKRWLFFCVHLLAVISVVLSQIALLLQVLLALMVLLSAFKHWLKVEPVWSIRWDLDEGQFFLAKGEQPYRDCIGIHQLYLIFGLLHLQIERAPKDYINLLIFPDSVDKQSLRRLRVAARWANIKPKSE